MGYLFSRADCKRMGLLKMINMDKNKTIVIMSVLIALSVVVCVYAFTDADDVSATSTFGGGGRNC